MQLDEILAQVESEELKEAIIGKINEEKERGITAYSKKDKEVLKYKNALKDLGYNHDKFSDVNEFIESKKNVEQKVNDSQLTIASLNDKLNDLTSKLEQEKAQAEQAKRVAKEKTLTTELTKSIGSEFYGANYLIKTLVGDGRVDLSDNGEIYFKDGENIIPFDKGIDQLKEENKDMLKMSQTGGTGLLGGYYTNPEEPSFAELLKKELNK